MNDLFYDITHAWRNLLAQPATSLLIIITLALGIGGNTAMFSMAWHVMLAPLPYADQDRLVRLEQNGMKYQDTNAPWSDLTLNDVRTQTTSFSHLVEYTQGQASVVGRGEPYQAFTGNVGWDYFDMLGIRPLYGRDFGAGDDAEGAEPVMLLSYEFWTSKFNADMDVIGSALEMRNIVYRVVGVLPAMPPYPQRNDVWVPASQDPFRVFEVGDVATNRESQYILSVIGKLQENISLAQANSDLDAIAGRLIASYPDVYQPHYSITLKPLKDELAGASATTIALLMAMAFLVLLIASANVANLNLASTAARTQEFAIREAVGASRWRIRQQLLTESLLLALAGGVLAIVVAYIVMDMLATFAGAYSPLASEIGIDAPVLLFSLVVAILTGLVSGSAMAYKSSNMLAALKEGGDKITPSATGKRKSQLFLLAQFALAFVAITTSALITLSLYRLANQNAGYKSEQVLAVTLLMNNDLAVSTQQHMQNFWPPLLDKIKAIPGVTDVGFLSGAPLLKDVAYLREAQLEVDDLDSTSVNPLFSTNMNFVSASYFGVMDIPLLQGNLFDTSVEGSAPAVIINATLAEKFFPAGNAIGKMIRFPNTEFGWTITGVAANVRARSLDQEQTDTIYIHRQLPTDVVNIYLKSTGNLAELANVITGLVYEIDPRQSIDTAQSLEETRAAWLAPARLRGMLIFMFGALALLVTLSGVVGVVSCSIAQRGREIGIHLAVGATPANVVLIFVTDGLKIYLGGLLAGMVLMVLTASFLEPLLYETDATAPIVYIVSTAVLTLAVLLALIVPARAASVMSPAEALRSE